EIVQNMTAEDATGAAAVAAALPDIAAAVEAIAAQLAGGGRLIYVGAGTSGRLGLLDAVECVPTFGVAPETVQALIAGGTAALARAVEGAEDDRAAGRADLLALNLTAQDAVVGIAASGRTPYVVAALEAAAETGALTVGVACSVPAPALDAAQIRIAVLTGPEVIAGSTRLKAGTAQKMVLNMLSTGAMARLGKVYGNLMVDVRATNQKLAARARRIVAQLGQVDEDTAARLLAQAGGAVKPAVVMARRGVDAAEAQRLLDQAGGFLRCVID
ncbi:MAG: N-acetylmuramic acid 6-phosphate etherase, partial [Aggregatilineales bacterium]